jgi:ArsR family transcriptional regulator
MKTPMDDSQFHRIAKALADPTRFGLLERIGSQKEMPCATLASECGITQATISHHLKELADSGLVESRREGKFMILNVRRDRLTEYQKELRKKLGLR